MRERHSTSFRIAVLIAAVLAGLAGGYAAMAMARPHVVDVAAANTGPGDGVADRHRSPDDIS